MYINAKYNKYRLFMLLIAICLSVKYIFIDFGIDAAFQISMSYRLADGDIMFKEMWEPYQMSTFLSTFFIKIYMGIFHTTTGIVLYLQFIGVLIDGAIACFLYRIVDKHFNCRNTAFAMAWVFFLVSPKDVPLPEYANMQVWFSTLLCIALFLYYKTKKRAMLILAALCLCGTVLAYPSCIIILLGIVFLLLYRGKRADACIFIGICCLTGILYLCLIFRHISVDDFIIFFKNMLSLETSHSMGIFEKICSYCKEFLKIAIVFCVVYGIAFVIVRMVNKIKKETKDRERSKVLTDMLFFMLIIFISAYSVLFWQQYIRYCYSLTFVAIIIIGLHYVKRLSQEKFYFYLCGMVISLLQLIATLLLTNLQLIASVPYLLLAVMVSFLPISEECKLINVKETFKVLWKATILCSVLFLIVRNVYIIRPMSGDVSSILQVRGIVKEGPAKGIISEYMGPYMQNESMKEWDQYIKEGDTIYLIGSGLDTLGYLYANTNIAAPSLVPTPGYNESILKYWELNPHKYPDVIIASCWYGTLNLSEDSWIMNWIEKEYRPQYTVDGKYWRYYFKNYNEE